MCAYRALLAHLFVIPLIFEAHEKAVKYINCKRQQRLMSCCPVTRCNFSCKRYSTFGRCQIVKFVAHVSITVC